MNRDEITRMAREAGFVVDEVSQQHQPNCILLHTHYLVDELLARFAALVAAAEREACAKVCDEQHDRARTSTGAARADACAAAIRARGQQ